MIIKTLEKSYSPEETTTVAGRGRRNYSANGSSKLHDGTSIGRIWKPRVGRKIPGGLFVRRVGPNIRLSDS